MSHLFISEYQLKEEICTLDAPELYHQITRVLRMKTGDFFFIQDTTGQVRHKLCLTSLAHNRLVGTLQETYHPPKKTAPVTMYIAMPNKFDKAELIVQKLSEIGVDRIVFWASHRSVLRDMPEKKMQRLLLIAREAVEQSWGRHLPEIKWQSHIVFDPGLTYMLCDWRETFLDRLESTDDIRPWGGGAVGILIGPEGGFHDDEITSWLPHLSAQRSLGEHVLRMETASIVAAWCAKISRSY